jgi:DNA-binding MurR/RpiR family transcriptional regulator
MPTYNDERLVVNFEDLKRLIRDEISQFREELRLVADEFKRGQHLDVKLLNITDVAARYRVSKATVHTWMKKGLIGGFKQGKGRFFYQHELDQKLRAYKYFEMLQNTGEIPKGIGYMQYHKEKNQ